MRKVGAFETARFGLEDKSRAVSRFFRRALSEDRLSAPVARNLSTTLAQWDRFWQVFPDANFWGTL